jgi:hypothetical protein
MSSITVDAIMNLKESLHTLYVLNSIMTYRSDNRI